jgi:hypothetical protein
MAVFAVLHSTSITNVIVADTLEIAELVTQQTCVEVPEGSLAGIGWTYENNEFVAPPVQEVPKDSKSVV